MSKQITIEIDSEVFEFLQRSATPLVDTPNDVLRRLLLPKSPEGSKEGPRMVAPAPMVIRPPGNADAFVGEFLKREFGPGFNRRGRLRLMFESPEQLFYIQNFNKQSLRLWYRVTENPWRELQLTKKQAWLCFTNPAERFAYVLPVDEVLNRVKRANRSRDYLEVNIDPVASRWVEFDWKIESFLKHY